MTLRAPVIPAPEPESIDGCSARNGSRIRPGMTPIRRCFKISRKVCGFTLLEVMVALLVIALGIGAVINTTSESGWKSSQLRQKTIASWVAQNQIALYRAKRTWSNKTNLSGDVDMANATWRWEMKISGTDDPSLRLIDVDVYLKDQERLITSLTGFIARL